ncbi:MAG: MFS transporter [Acidobacteriota bacterium]
MTTPATAQPTEAPRQSLIHAGIVIIVGVLATTLALTHVLGRIPIQNLLKNELNVDRAGNAAFFFWMTLPWYLKPLAGIVTDAFPLFGSRRRSYILLGTVLTVLSWFALAYTPHQYNYLLAVVIAINTFTVIASTVVGGYMVEVAQAIGGSGRLTALRTTVQNISSLIAGPLGGYLATVALGWTAISCAGVMFLLVPAALLFMHEKRIDIASSELFNNARTQLRNIAAAKSMWAASGLMALFYIAPGISTALFYKQQNELHIGTEAQGYLQLITYACAIAASLGYGFVCRRISLRTLLFACLLAATFLNLGYLYYSSFGRAQWIDGLNGFGYTLAELALMDLAIRATPRGSEGMGFSLMMSVRNLALYGTDWIGSKLLDDFHVPFSGLVLSNSATTLLAVPLIFLLPRLLISTRDAEPVLETPAPRASLQE